jgi:hypothetical protein
LRAEPRAEREEWGLISDHDHQRDPDPEIRIARMFEREERRHRARVRAGVGAALVFGLLAAFLVAGRLLPAAQRALASEFAQPAPPSDAGWVVEPLAGAPDPATRPEPNAPAPAQPADPPGETPQTADPSSRPAPKPAEPSAEPPAPKPPAPKPAATAQRFEIAIGARGYEPSSIAAAADRPIELTVARGEGCAAGFLMPALGIEEDNSAGPVTIRLGKLKPGTYTFTCGMAMVTGKLTVR